MEMQKKPEVVMRRCWHDPNDSHETMHVLVRHIAVRKKKEKKPNFAFLM